MEQLSMVTLRYGLECEYQENPSSLTYIYGFTVTKKNGEFCGCFVSQQASVLRNIFVRLIFLFIIIFDTQF